MLAKHLRRGSTGENLAREFLQGKGYQILHSNWRTRQGELDLVCSKQGQFVFVEVKTRASKDRGEAGEALDHKKRSRLLKAARAYLTKHDLWQYPCRFDLISIYISRFECTLEHMQNVIQYPQALGGVHTHWQPW
ncbi:MAG: YraN family protein [Desulfohalobiaceae bacterium]